jgi:uncharacterized membrane protein
MLDVLISKPSEKDTSDSVLKMSDRADKPVKSVIKALSWRIVGTLDTMIISYIVTGKITLALSIGSVEVITKTVLYYFHERLWAHIHRINIKLRFRTNEKRYRVEGIKQSA